MRLAGYVTLTLLTSDKQSNGSRIAVVTIPHKTSTFTFGITTSDIRSKSKRERTKIKACINIDHL